MNRKLLAYVVPMVVVWGSFAGIVMIPLRRLPVPMVILVNLVTALLFLSTYLALTGRFRTIARYSTTTWLRLALTGFFGSFLYYTLYFYGFKTAGNASAVEVCMMNFLFPITTVIFSALLLREHVTPLGVVSILISFAGAYVILTRGHLLHFRLDAWQASLLGLGAALAWGLFTALGRKWATEPIPALFVYYLTAIALTALWLLCARDSFILPTPRELLYISFAGMISNCLGVILWFKALKVANATLVGNIAYSAAFLSILVLHFLVGSPVRISSLAGLCLISVGVFLASRWGTAKDPVPRPDSARPPRP